MKATYIMMYADFRFDVAKMKCNDVPLKGLHCHSSPLMALNSGHDGQLHGSSYPRMLMLAPRFGEHRQDPVIRGDTAQGDVTGGGPPVKLGDTAVSPGCSPAPLPRHSRRPCGRCPSRRTSCCRRCGRRGRWESSSKGLRREP